MIKTALIILLFSLQVQAEEHKFGKPQEKVILETPIIFAAGTLIESSEKSLKLLQGDMWIQKAKRLKIETVYGDFVVDGENAFIGVDLKTDKVMLRLGNARALIKPRAGEMLPINFGEEMWLGSMDREGNQFRGAPVPVQWSWYVKEWGRKFPFKEKIQAAIPELKKISKERVEVSSEIQRKVVDRKIAALKEQEEAELAKRRAKDAQKSWIRRQFFDRVFFR